MASAQQSELDDDLARYVFQSQRGSDSDGEELNTLLDDYRFESLVDSENSDSESDIGVITSEDDSAAEDQDRATVEIDSFARIKHRVETDEGNVAEHVDTEIERATAFTCNCSLYNDGPCCRQFLNTEIAESRMNMKEMTEAEKDLILLGVCRTSMNRSEYTQCTHRGRQLQRTRARTSYLIEGKKVCAATFRYIHAVSKDKLSAVQKWYRECGLTPRRKKSGGRVECERTLSYEDISRIYRFIDNYAEENALVLPGRVPGYKRGDLRLLPSVNTKAGIWRDSYKPAIEAAGHRAAELTTFRRIWRQLCPHIVCCKPMTDLCWECQNNNGIILRAVNCPENEKSERLQRQELHLEHVRAERALYRRQVADAKVVAVNLRLGENQPCSRDFAMHYSFDFAQQVHYPSDPLQPGPLYFLTPRKCGIFGVCCEGVTQQVNYLIDEGMATSKGSDAVISYLHHFFVTYGLGEKTVSLHCDNCAGQNKNRYMLFYLLWRTIHHLHLDIELNFMVAGHTKFAPDWCFGLLKQKYRRMSVSCLDDIVKATNDSTTKGVNIGQLVGPEDQQTVNVPLYNWQAFLSAKFKPLVGIKKYQHFRFSSKHPGIVFAKKMPTDDEETFSLLHRRGCYPSAQLPASIPPPGLDLQRQWYLHDRIREFCRPECADITCPRPTTAPPSRSAAVGRPAKKARKN